ncbi:tetratricopeptide repeat protein [Halanaerobium kushneri]|uniref:Tfp pilus assembly protein PilF n=1 Tax=Halanaerobium kushneri TaxID=56779 RepID=A0A1N6SMP8_9FIRM|nr:hypothetical protein [Halanaerobium kushneri]SIQ42324.1 Tfp pilus assembly protein PilF [Halanaerobium kushneri]
MAKVNIGLVQMKAHPAFSDKMTNQLSEPITIFDGIKLGDLLLDENGYNIRDNIRKTYIKYVEEKVNKILKYISKQDIDILIFPEYSVPAKLLEKLKTFSSRYNVIIIAGSHTILDKYKEIYSNIGINFNLDRNDSKSDIRKSISPIFFPNKTEYIEKINKSSWESSNILGETKKYFEYEIGGEEIKFLVQICIDALINDHKVDANTDFIIIPSWSPKTSPFLDIASIDLLNEKSVIYCNIAQHGNSFISTQVDQRTSDYHIKNNRIEPIKKEEEAIIITKINTNSQYIKRATVKSSEGPQVLNYSPLIYLDKNSEDELKQEIENNQEHENIMEFIEKHSSILPEIYIEKLKLLMRGIDNGSLNKEDIRYLIDFCPVNKMRTFEELELDLVNYTIEKLQDVLVNNNINDLDKLAKYIQKLGKERKKLEKIVNSDYNISNIDISENRFTKLKDQKLEKEVGSFQNRGQELVEIREFMDNGKLRFLGIYGMRGIGKTSLLSQAFIKMFPDIKKYRLELTPGSGFTKLLGEIANSLDISVNEEDLIDPSEDLFLEIRSKWDTKEKSCLIIDNWSYLLDHKRELDPKIIKFLEILSSSEAEKIVNKIIILSDQRVKFPFDLENDINILKLKGFKDPKYTIRLYDYWMRSSGLDTTEINIPDRLVEFLDGHPLAIKIASSLSKYYPPKEILDNVTIFSKFQDKVINLFLEKIDLNKKEKDFIKYASIYRIPVSLDAYRKFGGDEVVFILEDLIDKFLIELNGEKYKLHPSIKSFYYNKLSEKTKDKYNEMAFEYFNQWEEDYIKKPIIGAEAFHHAVSANKLKKMRELYNFFHTELRPIAKEAYKNRNNEKSIKLYKLIYEIEKNDYDALFHISMCQGRLGRWKKSNENFIKSLEMAKDENIKPWWMLQGYGSILLKDRKFGQSEGMFMEALELVEEEGNKCSIYEGLGRLRAREGDTNKAEEFFKKGIDICPNDTYLLGSYIVFLKKEERYSEAMKYANKALKIDPTNKFIIKQKKEIERIKQG